MSNPFRRNGETVLSRVFENCIAPQPEQFVGGLGRSASTDADRDHHRPLFRIRRIEIDFGIKDPLVETGWITDRLRGETALKVDVEPLGRPSIGIDVDVVVLIPVRRHIVSEGTGAVVAGVKYMFVRGDADSVYVKKGAEGVYFFMCNTCVVVAYHNDKVQAGACNATAGKLVDFLKENSI